MEPHRARRQQRQNTAAAQQQPRCSHIRSRQPPQHEEGDSAAGALAVSAVCGMQMSWEVIFEGVLTFGAPAFWIQPAPHSSRFCPAAPATSAVALTSGSGFSARTLVSAAALQRGSCAHSYQLFCIRTGWHGSGACLVAALVQHQVQELCVAPSRRVQPCVRDGAAAEAVEVAVVQVGPLRACVSTHIRVLGFRIDHK